MLARLRPILNAARRRIATWAEDRESVARPVAVTVFGKAGCHLCDDADALLSQFQPRYRLTVHHVDITSDRDLFRRFDIRIPVFQFADGSELSAPITEQDLARQLKRAARQLPDAIHDGG